MESSSSRNTAAFCAAYFLSVFGYEFAFFILTLAVFSKAGSAISVAVFTALTFAPKLFAPYFGVIADTRRQEKVLLFTFLAAGLLLAALAAADTVSTIYLLWFLLSVCIVFATNTRTSLMTVIMPQDLYRRGNAVVLTFLNIAKLSAPLLGGLLTGAAASSGMLWLAAGAFLLSALAASRITVLHRPAAQDGRVFEQLKEGWDYLIRHPQLRLVALTAFTWRLFLGMQVSLFVVFVKTGLQGSDADYGLFMTVLGLGSLAGGLIGPLLIQKELVKGAALVTGGLGIYYASMIFLGFAPNFPAALTAVFIGFLAFYAALVELHSRRDQSTPLQLRGRVYGNVTFLLVLATVISMLAGGYLATVFSAAHVLSGSAALALMVFAGEVWLMKHSRKQTSLNCSVVSATEIEGGKRC